VSWSGSTTTGRPTTRTSWALLEETARERLHAGQQVLELEMPTPGRADAGAAVVEATSSQILWEALGGVYGALGFAAVRDEAFRALVLGRIVEPTSKLDTVRVLGELGVDSPSRASTARTSAPRPGASCARGGDASAGSCPA
jgi:hypothetical protein